LRGDPHEVRLERGDRCVVCLPPRADENVIRCGDRQQLQPHDFANAALEPIPTDCGQSVFRDDDGHTQRCTGCLDALDVEQAGAQAFARPKQPLDVSCAGDSARAAETEGGLRRRRTCWAV
jgi:hypothetical protein